MWLLKRAQIAVSDLNLAFGGERWGDFQDVDQCTVFADNVLPNVLRVDGVLRYAPYSASSSTTKSSSMRAAPKKWADSPAHAHGVREVGQ